MNGGLARCGFGIDNNDVLAGNRQWRMSKADWLRTFDDCLRVPNESRLIRASVAFDFRTSAGGLSITASLAERMRAAREHPDFMRLLARTATGYPVALGLRGNLAVERHGEAAGRLDLKRGAIVPLVNLVRFHALANRVTISPTLDRIEAVASIGALERGVADALREAFSVITRLRFEHHAELIAAGSAAGQPDRPGRARADRPHGAARGAAQRSQGPASARRLGPARPVAPSATSPAETVRAETMSPAAGRPLE